MPQTRTELLPSAIADYAGRRDVGWEAVALTVSAFLLLLLTMPRMLNVFDEGILLTGAMRVLDGQIVHRDFLSVYGPAQYYMVAAALKWLGGFNGARVYDLLLRALICGLSYYVLRGVVGRRIALVFAGIAAVWLATTGFYLYPVFPCAVLALLGSLLTARAGAGIRDRGSLFAAGLCAGAAALFRYDVGAFLVVAHLVSFALITRPRAPPGSWFSRMATAALIYCAGVAIVFLPAAIAFLMASPLRPWQEDIIDYGSKIYPATRNLPFPRLSELVSKPAESSIYLPLLAPVLVGAEVLRQRGTFRNSAAFGLRLAVVLGITALLLFFKGVVRVSTIHMLLAILPGLLAVAIIVHRWWRGSVPLRLAAACAMGLIAIPTVAEAANYILAYRYHPEKLVAGELAVRAGLIRPVPELPAECATGPVLGSALLPLDYARVTHTLINHARPDEKILVALDRHDKVFVNPVALYFASNHLPGTRFQQFDPGIVTRADVQQKLIDELAQNQIRWVVRDASFDAVQEPNESSRSSGVTLLDQYLDAHYRSVAFSGTVSVWLLNGVDFGNSRLSDCEAGS